jgi:hypothetical protein
VALDVHRYVEHASDGDTIGFWLDVNDQVMGSDAKDAIWTPQPAHLADKAG